MSWDPSGWKPAGWKPSGWDVEGDGTEPQPSATDIVPAHRIIVANMRSYIIRPAPPQMVSL